MRRTQPDHKKEMTNEIKVCFVKKMTKSTKYTKQSHLQSISNPMTSWTSIRHSEGLHFRPYGAYIRKGCPLNEQNYKTIQFCNN